MNYIKNKNGSTLTLAIIAFALVMILGMGVLGVAQVSANQSKVEIDRKQAYYNARSVLDATVTSIQRRGTGDIKPGSTDMEWYGRLDGATCPSKDEAQFIVQLKPININKDYIVTALGKHNGQEAILSATLKRIGKNPFGEYVLAAVGKDAVLDLSVHVDKNSTIGKLGLNEDGKYLHSHKDGDIIVDDHDNCSLPSKEEILNTLPSEEYPIWEAPIEAKKINNGSLNELKIEHHTQYLFQSTVEDVTIDSIALEVQRSKDIYIFLDQNIKRFNIDIKKHNNDIPGNRQSIYLIATGDQTTIKIGDESNNKTTLNMYIYNPKGKVSLASKNTLTLNGSFVANQIDVDMKNNAELLLNAPPDDDIIGYPGIINGWQVVQYE